MVEVNKEGGQVFVPTFHTSFMTAIKASLRDTFEFHHPSFYVRIALPRLHLGECWQGLGVLIALGIWWIEAWPRP